MKRPWMGVGVFVGALGIAAAAVPTRLGAAPGPSARPSASATPPPVAAPSSSAAGTTGAPIEAIALTAAEIPRDKSPLPKRDEWQSARRVQFTRVGAGNERCSAELLREYLRVTCTMSMSVVRQYVGGTDDVAVRLIPDPGKEADNFPIGGEVVFPLRRGDGYLFAFFGVDFGYAGGAFPSEPHVVDAFWPEGDPAPTVVIR